jgi:hypothetical protein
MFVKYENQPKRNHAIGKKIGITSNYRIVFYRDVCCEINGLTADLFYDSETNSIGVMPVDFNGAYKISFSSTPYIRCKKFFIKFNIPVIPGRYEYTIKDGMMVIQLPENEEPK